MVHICSTTMHPPQLETLPAGAGYLKGLAGRGQGNLAGRTDRQTAFFGLFTWISFFGACWPQKGRTPDMGTQVPSVSVQKTR